MSFDARAIANFILDYCDERERTVSNLALQKIIYFCHVWALLKTNEPLVRQDFEAWEHGPVVSHLYREFKEFNRQAITKRATQLNRLTGGRDPVEYELPEELRETLSEVVDFYSLVRPGDLVELSHVVGGPCSSPVVLLH